MFALCVRLAVCCACLIGLGLLAKDLGLNDASSDPILHRVPDADLPQASLAVLLTKCEVRHELVFDKIQAEQIDDWLTDLMWQLEQSCPRISRSQYLKLEAEERDSQLANIRQFTRDILENSELQLQTILRPEQFLRLNQVRIQQLGMLALQRPDVIQRLGLSRSQREAIGEISVFGLAPYMDPAARDETRAKLEEVLTEVQLREWDLAFGEPFAIPAREKDPRELKLLNLLLGLEVFDEPQRSPQSPTASPA